MFRTQNLVPEVYPNQSRDFQMFCRLYDLVFNSTKQSIDSMRYTTSSLNCNSKVLPLLKTKVGLFTDVEIAHEDLRIILSAFPYIVKYKGSMKSLEYVVNLYARLTSSAGSYIKIRPVNTDYVISIISSSPIQKTELLFDMLKYIIPSGYVLDYYVASIVNIENVLEGDSSVHVEIHPKGPKDNETLYVSKVVVRNDLGDSKLNLNNIVNMASVSDYDDIRAYLQLNQEDQS